MVDSTSSWTEKVPATAVSDRIILLIELSLPEGALEEALCEHDTEAKPHRNEFSYAFAAFSRSKNRSMNFVSNCPRWNSSSRKIL
jgi:hypothetical protein